MNDKFSLEIVHRIYDDTTGNHIEVGPDHDTGGLIEIRQIEDGKLYASVSGMPEQMRMLAQSILALTGGTSIISDESRHED